MKRQYDMKGIVSIKLFHCLKNTDNIVLLNQNIMMVNKEKQAESGILEP